MLRDSAYERAVWCGVVWCGVVWCGVVWCGVVWCGVVWCGVVWCGVVWCGVVWCGVVWCGVVWCGVVWCGVVWCGHVMSCHGALEPSSAGPPSGRPSAERLAVTHTRTPMEWAPGEGGPRAPCMARRREAPGPSKVHHGQASGRSETPVPPTGPGFLGTGGSPLDGRRAHSRHTW